MKGFIWPDLRNATVGDLRAAGVCGLPLGEFFLTYRVCMLIFSSQSSQQDNILKLKEIPVKDRVHTKVHEFTLYFIEGGRGMNTTKTEAIERQAEESKLPVGIKPANWRHHQISYANVEQAKEDITDQFNEIGSLSKIAYDNIVLAGLCELRPKPEFDWRSACFLMEQIEEKVGIISNALSFIEDIEEDNREEALSNDLED